MATVDSSHPPVYRDMSLPPRRRIDRTAALTWLDHGRHYFNRARGLSIAYGATFAVIGMLITLLGLSQPQFVFAFWSGFLLIGPLLATGLYRVAQMQDRGEPVTLSNAARALKGRLGSVVLFALLLALVMIAWIRFSTLIAALYVGNIAGTASLIGALGSPEGIGFLVVLFGVGALFAAAMFALTAWSLPMVLDGRADFVTAITASVKATIEQPVPMLIWGAVVAGLTILGMLTLFATFVVIFPWLGYATWAAYKELFAEPG